MANDSDPPTTPQTKSPPLGPDTVSVPRSTSQSDDTRDLPCLETYLQVPYATLVRLVLGSPPDSQEISHIRQKLTEEGILSTVQSTLPSKLRHVREDEAYEPLGSMISSILGQAPDCPFSFVAGESAVPSSHGYTTDPDACIILGPPCTNKRRWYQVAIPFEFDKYNDGETEHDDRQNMIWNLQKVMRADPCRRFILGITVEDTTMRICYGNRALLAVSEPVDVIQDIDQVISLFCMIGQKREVDLGWDPTVERINAKTYKFTIGGQFYTTKCPLAMYGADNMIGSGTRVYLAQDMDGNEVAIKDAWRDHDHESEGTILSQIFQDIRAKFGEASDAEKYFVQILVCEDVVVSGRPDITLTLENEEDVKWTSVEACRLSSSPSTPSTGNLPPMDVRWARMLCNARQSVTVPCRIHTRTVFKDVGRPLGGIKVLTDSFSCLSDALKALYYLHKAGWVHRDFSVTNVLWVEEDGRYIGKLSDFEYAKKVDFNTLPDCRTGTRQFMAVEVVSRLYLFMPKTPRHDILSHPPFHMNYFHDLESHWWAAVWILLYHTDKKSPPENLYSQLEEFNRAFPPSANGVTRFPFFEYPYHGWFSLSASYRDQCKPVFEFAYDLQNAYEQIEKSFPTIEFSDTLVDDLHKKASDLYRETRAQLQTSDIRLQTLYNALKRRNSGDSPTDRADKKVK